MNEENKIFDKPDNPKDQTLVVRDSLDSSVTPHSSCSSSCSSDASPGVVSPSNRPGAISKPIQHTPADKELLKYPFFTYEFALSSSTESILDSAMNRCVKLEPEALSFNPFINKYYLTFDLFDI